MTTMAAAGGLRPGLQIWLETGLVGLLCLMLYLGTAASAETVFFNKFGHCMHQGNPFDVDNDVYTLKSTGGSDAYETSLCKMTFQSSSDERLCLIFYRFQFDTCGVTLKIYESQTASGKNLETLSCLDPKPSEKICTQSPYVTVVLKKETLNNNQGYMFEIDVLKESDIDLSDDAQRRRNGAFESNEYNRESIGKTREKTSAKTSSTLIILVACVLGVIVVIAAISTIALYFCRRKRGSIIVGEATPPDMKEETTGNTLMPSAPLMEDPPPYVDPPPYEEEFHGGRGTSVVYENASMLANR
ncbi:hypothetical protein EGW08_008409 [Elysia chlorotica]|uniref:CUB domain-containing protein n=1 Tax=Elysia chlorotica TaxID=188477 RepID=A0A433TQQ8_ELYCH|nr:hypothetical protein EGW08_008409 [Elysia chlorotica]